MKNGQKLKQMPSGEHFLNQNRSAEAEDLPEITCREFRAPLRDTSRKVILEQGKIGHSWGRQESIPEMTLGE